MSSEFIKCISILLVYCLNFQTVSCDSPQSNLPQSFFSDIYKDRDDPPALDVALALLGYITPRNGAFDMVSQSCIDDGNDYILGLPRGNVKHMKMFDASAFFPASGFLSDNNLIHYPGSFEGCLDENGADGRYCLMTTIGYMTAPDDVKPPPDFFPDLEKIKEKRLDVIRNEHFIPDVDLLETLVDMRKDSNLRYQNPNCRKLSGGNALKALSGITKVGKCVPKSCSDQDVFWGAYNYLLQTYSLRNQTLSNIPNSTVLAIPLACKTADEKIPLTNGDIVMIVVISVFTLVIFISTWLDIGINLLGLKHLPESLLPVLQGFSAYHNTVKIFAVGTAANDGNNLACINGLKYISISWIVAGHVLWEYIPVSGYGVLSNSATSAPQGTKGIAFTAVWNGLIGVDSFFVIGGCLLSFHTMSQIDKTKGGNVKMWIMFYVHRYIRLTGVYGVIIALHTTLLKFFATGPQSFLVDNLVSKCQKGWWTNLLYINNFAKDIYGPGKADCINVSWYMAIDMQYFVLTPILLSIFWRWPKVGYSVTGFLITAGTACQIYFTYVNDEFFHGGFSYYVSPWNRSQPYLIGLLLGLLLHKMRDIPTLKIHGMVNIMIWMLATVLASASVYGVSKYNICEDVQVAVPCSDKHPPMVDRIAFNGFAKIAWGLSISWLILACVKGRGGPINSFLSWSVWVPLARLQYCVYLLHRSIIYIVNSQQDYVVRYSHTVFTFQFLSILAISTFAAFIMVLMFEAPIVHMEKLLYAALGIGKMPQKRKAL